MQEFYAMYFMQNLQMFFVDICMSDVKYIIL